MKRKGVCDPRGLWNAALSKVKAVSLPNNLSEPLLYNMYSESPERKHGKWSFTHFNFNYGTLFPKNKYEHPEVPPNLPVDCSFKLLSTVYTQCAKVYQIYSQKQICVLEANPAPP